MVAKQQYLLGHKSKEQPFVRGKPFSLISEFAQERDQHRYDQHRNGRGLPTAEHGDEHGDAEIGNAAPRQR